MRIRGELFQVPYGELVAATSADSMEGVFDV
jgi:hypothetical protein